MDALIISASIPTPQNVFPWQIIPTYAAAGDDVFCQKNVPRKKLSSMADVEILFDCIADRIQTSITRCGDDLALFLMIDVVTSAVIPLTCLK